MNSTRFRLALPSSMPRCCNNQLCQSSKAGTCRWRAMKGSTLSISMLTGASVAPVFRRSRSRVQSQNQSASSSSGTLVQRSANWEADCWLLSSAFTPSTTCSRRPAALMACRATARRGAPPAISNKAACCSELRSGRLCCNQASASAWPGVIKGCTRQRLRIVGSRRLGWSLTSSRWVSGVGSSKDLSKALAALRFIASAGCRMMTLRPPCCAVCPMKSPSWRIASIRMALPCSSGSTTSRSGWLPACCNRQLRQRPQAWEDTGCRQSRWAAKASANSRLPTPGNPANRNAWAWRLPAVSVSQAGRCQGQGAAAASAMVTLQDFVDDRLHGRAHRSQVATGVDYPVALRLRSRPGQIGSAYGLEERLLFPLEAVQFTAGAGAGQAQLYRHVEKADQFRAQLTLHPVFQGGNTLRSDAATAALVGIGGVGKAITDDHPPIGERRPDQAVEVLGPGGEHEQQLGVGVHWLLMQAQQHLTDALGQRGTARLAGNQRVAAAFPQGLGKDLEVGGFAGAFRSLERDEQSTHGAAPLSAGSADGGLER